MVILMLNLLISIVSETYANIINNEAITTMKGRINLNDSYVNELSLSTYNKKPIYSIAFCCKCPTEGGGDSGGGI